MNNKFIDKKLKEFDARYPNWDIIPRDDVEQFIKEALEECESETKDIICAAIKPVFESWAAESRYVTGAWNTGEYVESDKQGDYWAEQRRTAWEQFARQLDNKIAMKTLDKLKSEQEECICHCHLSGMHYSKGSERCVWPIVSCAHCQKPEDRKVLCKIIVQPKQEINYEGFGVFNPTDEMVEVTFKSIIPEEMEV